MNTNWEQTARNRKTDDGILPTLVQILTLGIAEKPEVWEVEFKNKVTGETVRGAGPSPAAAEQEAKLRIQDH